MGQVGLVLEVDKKVMKLAVIEISRLESSIDRIIMRNVCEDWTTKIVSWYLRSEAPKSVPFKTYSWRQFEDECVWLPCIPFSLEPGESLGGGGAYRAPALGCTDKDKRSSFKL